MTFRAALLAVAAAACSAEGGDDLAMTNNSPGAESPVQAVPAGPVGIRPIPAIPAALRGCWDAAAPDDPDEPGGAFRALIDATTITVTADGVETRVASAEFVERVGPNMIEGRFTAPDRSGRATVATSLRLGPDDRLGIPSGTLRLAEGDAGSSFLSRCRE